MAIEATGKQITTDKLPIKEVFNNDMWFSIPDYQRPYVWGVDQITTLLDDISYAAKNTNESQYFLGSLVLHSEKRKNNGVEYIENIILDGQQRLTTLYLLHAVIRDLDTSPKRKNTCKNVIFQEGDPDDGIPERIRVAFEIRQEVSSFIDTHIKAVGGTTTEAIKTISKESKDISIKNMANAILLMRNWLLNPNTADINDFFGYLRQNVILIYVASAELEDAFRLFTVLNDRGIKLRNSDILKAQNLKAVSTDEKRKIYAKFWEDLEGELLEDFDLFLSYIRTIILKDKARFNLLKEFEDNIYNPKKFNRTEGEYEKIAPLLNYGDQTFDVVKVYKEQFDIVFGEENYAITNSWAFDNLIAVLSESASSDIWIPSILRFRRCFGNLFIFEFLQKLDNKFSGDWIAKETPTTRIEGMNNILKKIEEVSLLSDLSKEKQIQQLLNSEVFNFNTQQFIEEITHNKIYGRRFAKYLLRKIDFMLDAPKYGEKRISSKHITVEHILPQTPKHDSQWLQDFTPEQVEEWKHKLGNLILISRKKNSSQGRLDFKLKKEKYFINSIEPFPNSILLMQKDTWALQDVQQNHKKVIQLIKDYYKI